MLRRLRSHIEWLWMAALVLLLSLHFWFPEIGSGRAGDTYSTTGDGKKAFYRLAGQQTVFAVRNLEPLEVQTGYLEYGDTLCILGPARYPTGGEWDRLVDWVESGGLLIVAASQTDPKLAIERLGLSVRALDEEIRTGDQTDEAAPGRLETGLLSNAKLAWQSGGEIVVGSSVAGYEELVAHGGTVQAVALDHGNGRIVLIASDYVFSNRSLLSGDNAVLAFRLLEAAGPPDYVYFDESLNVSGTPKVVGLLLDPLLRPMTVQLLAVLVVFGWWRSRRFGPVLPASVSARHNIVDHTDTVGMLQYRVRGGAAVVRAYLKQLAGELHLTSIENVSNRSILDRLAARLGRSPDELQSALQEAQAMSQAPRVSRKDAAGMIRRLARLRHAQSG